MTEPLDFFLSCASRKVYKASVIIHLSRLEVDAQAVLARYLFEIEHYSSRVQPAPAFPGMTL